MNQNYPDSVDIELFLPESDRSYFSSVGVGGWVGGCEMSLAAQYYSKSGKSHRCASVATD
eukprot:1327697-Amorphochlora_amoeboformis.AAC.1